MGNISATKLGGICLIVGPALATILYVVLYMILGDSGIDPAKWADVAADAAARNNLEIILLMIPPIGIILAFYGLSVLHQRRLFLSNQERYDRSAGRDACLLLPTVRRSLSCSS